MNDEYEANPVEHALFDDTPPELRPRASNSAERSAQLRAEREYSAALMAHHYPSTTPEAWLAWWEGRTALRPVPYNTPFEVR